MRSLILILALVVSSVSFAEDKKLIGLGVAAPGDIVEATVLAQNRFISRVTLSTRRWM